MRLAFLGSSAAVGAVLFANATARQAAAAAAAEISPSSSGCDESKCRNPAPYAYGGYTCLAAASEPDPNSTEEHRLHAQQCADGYESRPIEDVDPVTGKDGVMYGYYTCCHPEYSGTVSQDCRYDIFEACTSIGPGDGGNVAGEGYDCWAVGTSQDPMTCCSDANNSTNSNGDGDVVPYFPRKTGAMIGWITQYVCCRTFDGVTTSVDRSAAMYHGFNAALNFVVFLVCVVFISGIMLSRKARSREFNLYLVFLAIPDAIYNGGHFVVNAGLRLHLLRGWLWWFNVAANMRINAIIAYEIQSMLIKAKRCRRRKTGPRSVRRVCTQAGAAYVFAVVPATWDLLLRQGRVGVLVWQPWHRFLAIALVFGPPLLYVVYACVETWRKRLLPMSGSTRTLAIYFLRVIFVFVFMWIPSIVIYQIGTVINAVWMPKTGVCISTLQGLVSVAVAMNKPDVRGAVVDLIMCRFTDSEANKAVPANGARERDPSSDDNTSESGNVVATVISAHSVIAEEVPAGETGPSSTYGEEGAAVTSRQHFSTARSKRISVWDEPDDWRTSSEPIAEEVQAVAGSPSRTDWEQTVAVTSSQKFSVERIERISVWDEPDNRRTQSAPVA